jgi:hypothetical protein
MARLPRCPRSHTTSVNGTTTLAFFWTTTKIDGSWGALRQKCHHDSHEHQDGRAGEHEGASRLRMGSARAALMAERDVPLVM